MALVQSTDHVDRAKSRILEQFKGNVTQPGIVAAFAKEVQSIEDAAFSLLVARLIDSAVGAQLDSIGRIVGADRAGLGDPDYRLTIKAYILINRRSGEIETLLQILALLVPGCTPRLSEKRIHSIEITSSAAVPANPARIRALLALAKLAGVRLVYGYQLAADSAILRFDSSPGLDGIATYSAVQRDVGASPLPIVSGASPNYTGNVTIRITAGAWVYLLDGALEDWSTDLAISTTPYELARSADGTGTGVFVSFPAGATYQPDDQFHFAVNEPIGTGGKLTGAI